MKRDTRTRILVASLLLFNEHGEPQTTTNEIADEVDISPGNLHYHFRKKSEIVTALLGEFQADARNVLRQPDSGQASLDDFWVFLHGLLECTAAYQFLFRDSEALVADYPQVQKALTNFSKGLIAVFELYLRAMAASGVLKIEAADAAALSRNLAVLALYSDRFGALFDKAQSADDAALRIAHAILSALKPYTVGQSDQQLDELLAHYR
jgi:AcrR family transcriptional regulator